MNLSRCKLLLYFSFIVLTMSGCSSLRIADLKPETLTSNSIKASTNVIVGIESIATIDSEYHDAGKWEQGLAEALRNEGVFSTVYHPNIDKDKIDILISGKVGGSFQYSGAKNFFTWWPGAIILAHGWRGTRYTYDAYADVKLINVHTGRS